MNKTPATSQPPQPPGRVVTCHLRTATTLQPAAEDRLADLLHALHTALSQRDAGQR
jgi:hypothetical protein